MTSPVDVAAAVIRDARGRLLIARRPDHKRHGGLWEFPGGKVDPGETLAQATARELREELGLTVTRVAAEPVFARGDPGQPFRILFLEVEVESREEMILMEHQAVAWVQIPVHGDYRLAPSDAAFVKALARGEVRLSPIR